MIAINSSGKVRYAENSRFRGRARNYKYNSDELYSKSNLVSLANSASRSSVSHSPVGFVTFTTSLKASPAIELCLVLLKYCKTLDSPKYLYIYIYVCVCVCVCVYRMQKQNIEQFLKGFLVWLVQLKKQTPPPPKKKKKKERKKNAINLNFHD